MVLKTVGLKSNNKILGFTIVELLVVIVIIGILAAITIVGYMGITAKAIETTIKSDLTNSKKQFALYYAEHGLYPTGLNENYCPTGTTGLSPDTNYCLKPSSGDEIDISEADGSKYKLTATKGGLSFFVTEDTAPAIATAGATNCPVGFILVPGSVTYGTSNFCVMKYEAKADDDGDGVGDITYTTGVNTWPASSYPISASRKLVSTSGGYPVVGISQTTAITVSQNYTKDCVGCHLINEDEWMTIAQNVLNVGSNWSSGIVGSGYVFSGHNDGQPSLALVGGVNDSDNYSGTENLSGDSSFNYGMVGDSQRRTLELSNGNVIWDISGNVAEWTSGQVSSAVQPGIIGNAYASWIEWPVITSTGSLIVNANPNGTSIVGANSWTSVNGIGKLMSNPSDTTSRGFVRSGCWYLANNAGLLSLELGEAPSSQQFHVGFRVAAPAF